MQAAPIALRSAKAAINQGLETDLAGGMKVEEQQYGKVTMRFQLLLFVPIAVVATTAASVPYVWRAALCMLCSVGLLCV